MFQVQNSSVQSRLLDDPWQKRAPSWEYGHWTMFRIGFSVKLVWIEICFKCNNLCLLQRPDCPNQCALTPRNKQKSPGFSKAKCSGVSKNSDSKNVTFLYRVSNIPVCVVLSDPVEYSIVKPLLKIFYNSTEKLSCTICCQNVHNSWRWKCHSVVDSPSSNVFGIPPMFISHCYCICHKFHVSDNQAQILLDCSQL